MFIHSWGLLVVKEEFIKNDLYRWPLLWCHYMRDELCWWHDMTGAVEPVTLTTQYFINVKEKYWKLLLVNSLINW